MENPLYNKDYLQQTAELLKSFKQLSYAPFQNEKEGILAEVGCGIGLDAINLVRMLEDTIKVIGIDIDETLLAEGKSKSKNIKNITFLNASADNLPFDNNSLSGIRNERLLQHLPTAFPALKEFYRVLIPGKHIVIAETDWNSIAFYNGSLSFRKKLIDYLAFHHVANGAVASIILHELKSIGFKEIAINIFPFVSQSLIQTISIIKLNQVLDEMETKNLIDSNEKSKFLSDLNNADKNKYFACSINLIMVNAIK